MGGKVKEIAICRSCAHKVAPKHRHMNNSLAIHSLHMFISEVIKLEKCSEHLRRSDQLSTFVNKIDKKQNNQAMHGSRRNCSGCHVPHR